MESSSEEDYATALRASSAVLSDALKLWSKLNGFNWLLTLEILFHFLFFFYLEMMKH